MIPVLNGISYIEPELTGLEENTNYVITLRANTIVGNGPTTSLQVLTNENCKFYLHNKCLSIPSVTTTL